MNTSELIYDWNQMDAARLRPAGPVLLNDETLRDGLQSPSVRDPSIAEKIQILHLMEALGINSLDLGLPGAGPRALADCEALAHEIVRHKMKIRANCAARTHENDIRPIADIVQRTGLNIQAATFIGSSPIRRYTEGWTDDFLLETTEKAVKFTVSLGLDCHVCDRGHEPLRSGNGQAPVFDRDQLRSAGHRNLRYRGTRDSHGRVSP